MNLTHEANPVRVNARVIRAVYLDRHPHFPVFELEDGIEYTPQEGMLSRYAPQIGDYLVTQEDGYEYFNPKDVFERKYHTI